MRRKRMKRDLAALGYEPWEPSQEQRELVRMYAFNDVPRERIAALLDISLDELVYTFHRELELGKDELLGWAAGRVVRLAGQNNDPGVALRASLHILQSRKKSWRIPAAETPDEEHQKPVAKLTLQETEAEIERILARRAGRGSPAGAAATSGEKAEGAD